MERATSNPDRLSHKSTVAETFCQLEKQLIPLN